MAAGALQPPDAAVVEVDPPQSPASPPLPPDEPYLPESPPRLSFSHRSHRRLLQSHDEMEEVGLLLFDWFRIWSYNLLHRS